MTDPASAEEYEELFAKNQHIEGYGINVTMYSPCPFCAHPDFMSWNIASLALTDYADMRKEWTCENCGRSGKTLIEHQQGGMTAQFVQTGGPNPPDWLQPPPSLVNSEGDFIERTT